METNQGNLGNPLNRIVLDIDKRIQNLKKFFADIDAVSNRKWHFIKQRYVPAKHGWSFEIDEHHDSIKILINLRHPMTERLLPFTFVYSKNEIYEIEFSYEVEICSGRAFRYPKNPFIVMPGLDLSLRITRIDDCFPANGDFSRSKYFDGISATLGKQGGAIAHHQKNRETVHTNLPRIWEDGRLENRDGRDVVYGDGKWYPYINRMFTEVDQKFLKTPSQTIFHSLRGFQAGYKDTFVWPYRPAIHYDDRARRMIKIMQEQNAREKGTRSVISEIKATDNIYEAGGSRNEGNAKMRLQDWAGAIQDFTKAIELDPENESAYFDRGLARGNSQDNTGAIQDFTKAIELNNEYENIWFYCCNRGIIKIRLQDNAGAVQDFTKVIEDRARLYPSTDAADKFSRPYLYRGLAKSRLQDSVGALQDFTKAMQMKTEYRYDSWALLDDKQDVIKALKAARELGVM